jgi:hypothetical protein
MHSNEFEERKFISSNYYCHFELIKCVIKMKSFCLSTEREICLFGKIIRSVSQSSTCIKPFLEDILPIVILFAFSNIFMCVGGRKNPVRIDVFFNDAFPQQKKLILNY